MLTTFSCLAFLVACGDQKEAKKSETEVTSVDVKKEAKEAMETAKIYAHQQKEEYLQQIEAKIKEYDREMQELLAKAQSKATDLKEESKAQFNQSMEELSNKKKAAAEKLNELNSASAEAWGDIKSGMD